MSTVAIAINSPSEELISRLNSRVYPVATMEKRPAKLQAEFSVPDNYVDWFCRHCLDLGIAVDPIEGRSSLLERIAADDLED